VNVQDQYNAFVKRKIIRERVSGPLKDYSFAVKDNVAVANQPFTAGHPLLSERKAAATAPAVQKFFDAGAQFVGMTQTDAGGFGAVTPQTKNPINDSLMVGGSSGGSAAAILGGNCDFAVGTDTGGSVRIPAACTGLFAFKPSFGRVSNDGVFPLAQNLDHVGILARSIDILINSSLIMLESSGFKNANKNKTLKVAVEKDTSGFFADEIKETLDRVVNLLTSKKYTVEYLIVPGRKNLAEAHGIIVLSEALKNYKDLSSKERQQLGKAAQKGLEYAEKLTHETISGAWEWAKAAKKHMEGILSPYDILISPTLPILPPARETYRIKLNGEKVPVTVAMTAITCLANITGAPVVTIPDPGSTTSPPISLQFMAKLTMDEDLLRNSKQIFADLREPGQ
tara:strand:- start:734 stop:1924 length:1191 start_codon:yes stop_codon:yes gene_type:complete